MNTKKITDARHITLLTLLCTFAYFVSYLTRKDLSAVLVAFSEAEGIEKSAVSALPVALFICYGVGQLVSGYLGDRISPRMLLTGGLLLTSAVNLAFPLLPLHSPIIPQDIAKLTALWGINGFAQAMMWPPMVKIMTELLSGEDYRKSCVTVSLGCSCGTMGIYLVSALFVKLFDTWRTVFFFSAFCGIVMAFIWEYGIRGLYRYAEKHGSDTSELPPDAPNKVKKQSSSGINPFTSSPVILIMLAIVFQGMLRDGLEQWMPSFLAEGYGLEASGAILSSVVMPIFTFVCIKLAALLYAGRFTNQLSASAFLFALSLAATLLLYLFFGTHSAIIGIVLISLAAGTMHGINLMLISYVPQEYERFGNVSFISGLLNFCTYIGSALFTYGIARLAETLSWSATILSWSAVSLLGLVTCLICAGRWEKFRKQ